MMTMDGRCETKRRRERMITSAYFHYDIGFHSSAHKSNKIIAIQEFQGVVLFALRNFYPLNKDSFYTFYINCLKEKSV